MCCYYFCFFLVSHSVSSIHHLGARLIQICDKTLILEVRFRIYDYKLEAWGTESSEHLFFTCDYSRLIWTKLLSWQGITRPAKTWQAELDWANRNARGKGPAAAIFRMSLAAAVYHIWIERNHRIFQAKSTEPHGITRRIVQDIFQRGSLKSKLNSKLAELNYYP